MLIMKLAPFNRSKNWRIVENHPKTLFHVDHVQGVTKVPLDFHESNVDFASISSHKFHGLKGTGAIYIRKGLKLASLLAGGDKKEVSEVAQKISRVSLQWQKLCDSACWIMKQN